MNRTLVSIGLLVAGAGLVVAGVFLFAGLGSALVAAGLLLFVAEWFIP